MMAMAVVWKVSVHPTLSPTQFRIPHRRVRISRSITSQTSFRPIAAFHATRARVFRGLTVCRPIKTLDLNVAPVPSDTSETESAVFNKSSLMKIMAVAKNVTRSLLSRFILFQDFNCIILGATKVLTTDNQTVWSLMANTIPQKITIPRILNFNFDRIEKSTKISSKNQNICFSSDPQKICDSLEFYLRWLWQEKKFPEKSSNHRNLGIWIVEKNL